MSRNTSAPQNGEWNAYWKDQRVAACRSDDEGLYRGVIGRYWCQRLSDLSADSRVLDLATGNAAIAAIALSQIQQGALPVFRFYGVDAAQINPPLKQLEHPFARNARFYSETSNEQLPFACAMFDMVTSQYGVEYGDLPRTLSETRRVLKPSGRVHWVCHWQDGDVAQRTRRELVDIDYLQSLNLVQSLQELVQIQTVEGRFIPDSHQKTAGTPQRQRVTECFNLSFQRLREQGHRVEGNLNVYLHNLAHLYQHREQYSVDLVHDKMAECAQELVYHRQRLAALACAALKPDDVENIVYWLENHGFTISSHGALHEDSSGQVVAYEISAQLQSSE